MSPNRVAALAAAASALVGATVTLLGAVPERWQGPVLIAGMFCLTVLAVVFMLGSQRWEKLIFDPEPVVDRPTPPAPAPLPLEDEDDPDDLPAAA